MLIDNKPNLNIYWRILFHFSWAYLPVFMIWNVVSALLLADTPPGIFMFMVVAAPVLFLYTLIRSFFVKDVVDKKLLRKSATWLFVDTFVGVSSLLVASTSL